MPDDQQQQKRSDPRRASDRIQLCVWPSPEGPCRKTAPQLLREGYDASRGGLILLQEHLRDAHLYPNGAYNEPRDWDTWVKLLQGQGLPISNVGLNAAQDPLYAAYLYTLSNGQAWLFAGTREQSELWIEKHAADLRSWGNRRLDAETEKTAQGSPQPTSTESTSHPTRPPQRPTAVPAQREHNPS